MQEVNTDSEGSETSDWGRPDILPVDMGFGHFMMNMQTGAIQWYPSGTMPPVASPDWVVMNNSAIPPEEEQAQTEMEPHRNNNNSDHFPEEAASETSRILSGDSDAANSDPLMGVDLEMERELEEYSE